MSTVNPNIPLHTDAQVRGFTREAEAFLQKFRKLCNQYTCSDVCSEICARIDPELADYLVELMNRDPHAKEVSPEVREKYCRFLDAIGDHMLPLVNEIDVAMSAGKGIRGLAELIALEAYHKATGAHGSSTEKEYAELEFLASTLADRELPLGSTVVLPNRTPTIWKVDFAEVHGGAFICILRPISDSYEAIVVCRGTACRPTSTGAVMSVLNDVIPQLGLKGVVDSWPSLKAYFSENKIKEVDIMGKSMGGAVAQQVAVLTQGTTDTRVKELKTLQSTGVHDEVHEMYQTLVDHGSGFEICAYRHAEMERNNKLMPSDLVPKVGGYHLGKKCRSGCKVYDVRDKTTPQHLKATAKDTALIFLALKLIRGLSSTHLRQLRFHDKGFVVVPRPEKGTYIKKKGEKRFVEQLRFFVAKKVFFILRALSPQFRIPTFKQLFLAKDFPVL